ncbi:hypothetical protein Cni_G12488 [Canna indica]|uniref:Uncharacterized protein n=1 Tax=Canna indica TaxID=4628 RepID=A0AAQ3K7X8_9LILI|nr:hypothetical protein Cni_G12488 [Canna indica]
MVEGGQGSAIFNPLESSDPIRSQMVTKEVDKFSSSRKNTIKVPISIDKNIEDFHKKMTEVMEIAVSEIKNNEGNSDFSTELVMVINALVTPIRGSPWLLSGIYASNCPKEMGCLWKFLSSIDTTDLSWVLIGDFNCINNQADKRGGNQFKWGHSIGYFNELCSSSGLSDVKLQGGRYTWCNNRLGKKRIFARLDKALVNWEWSNMFSSYHVIHLNKIAYDHKHVLFIAENLNKGKGKGKHFIFEHY